MRVESLDPLAGVVSDKVSCTSDSQIPSDLDYFDVFSREDSRLVVHKTDD
jgi:hypothetical protein